MKFPYGISDFELLRREGFYYCDRTDRIPLLEQAGYQLIFLRPRRFGKSLLLNMLSNYYDLKNTDKFEQLFGGLKIGQSPTAKHNQYFVMTWDFSAVLPMGSTDELRKTLYEYVNSRIRGFLQDNAKFLPNTSITIHADAVVTFNELLSLIRQTPYKLYLFIDEYDNFANEVMATKANENQRYAELVYGEGLLKTLFKNIKIAATGNGLERVFITGVSPVVLADMSSGYNVVVSISQKPEFNDLCGFHQIEVEQILKQIAEEKCQLTLEQQQEALNVMKQFYNGYNFSYKTKAIVYNPTLALYFFKHLYQYCEYPDELLDHNLAMDRSRLNYIARLPNGNEVIENALDETKDLFVPKIHDRFGVEDMLKFTQGQNELASLLYYLGVLTLNGMDMLANIKLRIPNLVIKSLYVEKLREILLPQVHTQDYQTDLQTLFSTGDLQPLCAFIEQRFSVFSNRDYRWSGEMALKTAFLMFLFDDRLYIIDSEPELNRRYADLVMIIRPDARQFQVFDFLFEFKFLTLKDLSLSSEQVKQLSDEQLSNLAQTQAAYSQATQQLNHYRHILEQQYGEVLRLKMFAVVAFGFDRILWTEISV